MSVIEIKNGDATEFQPEIETLHNVHSSGKDNYQPDKAWLENLGHKLYKRFFPGGYADRTPLILDLAPGLVNLPWEYLHDGKKFIALNPGIVRLYKNGGNGNSSAIKKDRLKMAVMLASPLLTYDPEEVTPINPETKLIDPFYNQPHVLNFRQEVENFLKLDGKPYPIDIDLHRRTRDSEFRKIINKDYDIIHFSGHGNEGSLCLEDGIAMIFNFFANDLNKVGINQRVKLVFLNGCLTATCGKNPNDKSMAEAFLSENIPWVIANQFSINVKSAGLLTESFYKNISEGFTIADALRLARIDLEENGLLPWDFGIPILFTTHCDLEKGELPVSEGKAKVKTRGGRLLEAKEERFAGRRRELIKIAKVFNGDGYFRGVMIHGAGGMGKTALALEAAHRFGEDFDEIVFASARKDAPSSELSKANPKGAGVSRLSGSVHDFLSQIMSELRSLHKEVNLPEGADFLNICNAISETIGNCGNSLVILDNLEDILRDFEISNDTDDKPVDVDPKFIEFINSLTKEKCKIVLTSRYDFTNLPVGEFKRIALKPLEGRELSDFFIELFDSKQTKPNYEAINAILSKTGGHPFTIRLAIGWLEEGWPLAEIFERFRDTTQKPWQYLVAESLKQMGDNENRLYRALSLFSKHGTKDMIRKVCGLDETIFQKALSRLQRFSIITKSFIPILETNYYNLIPIVREHAQRLSRANPEQEREMKEIFCDLILRNLANIEKMVENPGLYEYIYFNSELGNIAQGADFLQYYGKWDDAINIYRPCLAMVKLIKNENNEATLFNNIGTVYELKGEWDRAIEFYNKAINIYERLSDIYGLAHTYGDMGNTYQSKGELDSAIEFYNKSIEILERLGDIHVVALIYMGIGNTYTQKGDLDRAIEFHNKAIRIHEQLGDIHHLAQTYTNLGVFYQSKGDLDRAIEFYDKSIEILERLGDTHSLAKTYMNMGNVYNLKGELERAIGFYNKASVVFESTGDIHTAGITYFNIGNVYIQKNDFTLSNEYMQKAYNLFFKCHSPYLKNTEEVLKLLKKFIER